MGIMTSYFSLIYGLIQTVKDVLLAVPWTAVAAVLGLSCIATRVITGLQSRSATTDIGESRPIRMTPYWIPWIGHSLSFVWDNEGFIQKAMFVAHVSLKHGVMKANSSSGDLWASQSLVSCLVVQNTM